MRTFSCACGRPIYFQNSVCEHCGRTLGFLPDHLLMSAIESSGGNGFRSLGPLTINTLYRQCDNYRFQQVCNWLIEANDDSRYCRACRLNHTIPDLSISDNRVHWYRIEDAKRRLLYTLYRLGLPIVSRDEDPQGGLCFDFVADPSTGQKVYTGHDNGLITLNVAEADSSRREAMRERMGERYRTLLGHFRHEIGHYFWDKLVARSDWIQGFRELYGDERTDYDESLKRHHENGVVEGWQEDFVSAYASMHPWEDWAETWAHYLHITDTLETAADHGLAIKGQTIDAPRLLNRASDVRSPSPYDFVRQLSQWSHMTLAMNAINRSMGMPDPYPFVLGKKVRRKLHFIHCVIAQARTGVPNSASSF